MELDWPTEDQVWFNLRATRASPPGDAARTASRREVYLAALEQAEQLFRAAGKVPLATRPLLAFYGLSQAGRSIAAASKRLAGSDWDLIGHGLTIKDVHKDLPNIAVAVHGKPQSSFKRLSGILDSPLPLEGSTRFTLGNLWDAIPEGQGNPIVDDRDRRPVMYFQHGGHVPHQLAMGTVCGFPRSLAEGTNKADEFRKFMASYPHAAGYRMLLTEPSSEIPNFQVSEYRVDLVMHWDTGIPNATESQQLDRLQPILTTYGGSRYLSPAMPDTERPLHPLMTWWAVLYALSMLARYEPSAWSKNIDVNRSKYAVPLEVILKHALIAVPQIIWTTLTEVSK